MLTREDISRIVMGRGPTGDFGVWRKLDPDEAIKSGDVVIVTTPMRGETVVERDMRIREARSATESPAHGDEAVAAAALLPGLIETRGLLLAARILGKTTDEFALDLEYRIIEAERAAHAAPRS